MLRTILFFFTIGLILLITLPIWLIARLFPGKNPRKWPQLILDIFSPLVLWVAGFKIDIIGLEKIPDEPALFVGNHQGLLDMFVLLMKLGKLRPFLAKKEAEKIPVIASWMRMIGCVFIDRGNTRTAKDSIEQVEKKLMEGDSVIIFPEGKRSRCHEMQSFKPGAFRPAIRTGVPIVPFVIDGTYKAWEENHKITPCHCKLTVLDPIYHGGADEINSTGLAAMTEEKIREALG